MKKTHKISILLFFVITTFGSNITTVQGQECAPLPSGCYVMNPGLNCFGTNHCGFAPFDNVNDNYCNQTPVGELCCNSACPVYNYCGDGSCNGGENSSTCPLDCGSTPYCGDGVCNNGESSYTCQGDCGAPPTCVNDGFCSASDLINHCPDCGSSTPTCSGGQNNCWNGSGGDDSMCSYGFYCDGYMGYTCQYGGSAPRCGQNAENSWANTVFAYNATSYYLGSSGYFCVSGTPSPNYTAIPFPAQGDTQSWQCLPDNDLLACFSAVTCTARRALPPPPDLVASAPTPTTATAGSATSFSSTITNTGGVGTGSTFLNFFQIATAINGGGSITNLASSFMNVLNAGASAVTNSPSYTFPSAGSYSARACADKTNPSSTGSIAESNESNNCSTWQTITVNVALQPDLSLSAASITTSPIISGNSTNFRGTVNNTGTSNALSSQTKLEIDTNGSNSWTVGEPSTTQPTGALAIGGSEVEDLPLTLSAGNYSYRICADSGSAIAESDEGNNCSGWTSFTVEAVPVNGSCGTAAKNYVSGATSYSVPPDTYCAQGTASPASPAFPAQGGSTPWTCVGSGTGHTDASCSASRAAPVTITLNVTVSTAGQGTVTMPQPSLPDLICRTFCSVKYPANEVVVLTATPNSSRLFTGWTGCDSSTTNTTGGTCTVTVNNTRSVTAKFTVNPNFKEF